MAPAPTSGKVALQFGALFGVSLGVLLIAQAVFLPSPIFFYGLPVLALLLAGLFAARHTGKVSTGVLAGLWSGLISTITGMAAIFIMFLTVWHAALVSGAMRGSVDPRYAEEYEWIGLVIATILLSIVMMAIGAGLGALGGLIGKSMSPMARQADLSYPPAFSPPQAAQEFSYQSAPPPLPQNVYGLRPLWRVFYAGIYPLINVIVGFSLASNILSTVDSSAFMLFLICLLVLAVSYNIYYGVRMSMARLITSQVGVIYHGVGFRIYTPWHQIAGIGKVWKRVMPITGFTLRMPPVLVPSADQALEGQVPVIEISRWRRPFYRQYTKLIPLTWFVGNLQNSALGRDISWSAPQLVGGILPAIGSRVENHIQEMQ